MNCPDCGKKVKNLKMHQRYCIVLHPEISIPEPEVESEPEVIIPKPEIEPQPEPQPKTENTDNKEMKVAKILYQAIVKPLCDEHNIQLRAWEEIDQNDYFKIAGRIIKEVSA